MMKKLNVMFEHTDSGMKVHTQLEEQKLFEIIGIYHYDPDLPRDHSRTEDNWITMAKSQGMDYDITVVPFDETKVKRWYKFEPKKAE